MWWKNPAFDACVHHYHDRFYRRVNMKKLLIIVAALCLLSACKTQVIGLQQHASFDYQATTQHQFVIAGVVSTVEPLDSLTRVRFGDLLGRTFHQMKPHMTMISSGHVIKAIGQQSFSRLLDEYRLTGVLNVQDVDGLHSAFPTARYVMLCRIEKDQLEQSYDETETDVADSEEDRKKGEYEYLRIDVSLITSRDMGATLLIYDLNNNLLVWSGYVQKSDSNSTDSSQTFSKDKRWHEEWVDSFVSGLLSLDNDNYPQPPTQQDVLEDIFIGFAENMPETKK